MSALRNLPSLFSAISLAAALSCAVETNANAQARCDCRANQCAPAGSAVVTVRGRVTEATGRDANGQPERYLALRLLRPVCFEAPEVEHPERRRPVVARELQLVVIDLAMRTQVLRLLEFPGTLRGTLSERMTAHHFTPLLLDVQAVVARR